MQKRRVLRTLRTILIMILISVVSLEIALAVVDPYGVRYLRESAFYNRNYVLRTPPAAMYCCPASTTLAAGEPP